MKRKTKDVWVVQGNYGMGWEDLTEEDTNLAGRLQLSCYNENERGIQHRLIKRREAVTE